VEQVGIAPEVGCWVSPVSILGAGSGVQGRAMSTISTMIRSFTTTTTRPQPRADATRWRSGWKGRFNRQRLEAILRIKIEPPGHSSPQRLLQQPGKVRPLQIRRVRASAWSGLYEAHPQAGVRRHSLRRLELAGCLSLVCPWLQLIDLSLATALLASAQKQLRFSERSQSSGNWNPGHKSPVQSERMLGLHWLVTGLH